MNYLSGMFEKNFLNRDTFEFLLPKDTQTSQFYILPKIHKSGAPDRPIVSSCGAPTKKISKFAHYHIGPLVKTFPSYIYAKDTTTFSLNNVKHV